MTTIAFIGGGNMARSLIGGLIHSGTPPQQIHVSDPSPEQLGELGFPVHTGSDNTAALAAAEVAVLAVKPQVMRDVARDLAPAAREHRPLILSIAAGVREPDLDAWLGGDHAIVRCMPNTPALLGAGATGLYANARVSPGQRSLAERVMGSAGITEWVEREELLDAVTAVSGSGPAYFFHVMEAMEKAGVELGLDPGQARRLALQTALGAARMALENPAGEGPAELRRRVTSPGGTTERALQILQARDLEGAFGEALAGAAARCAELSDELGSGA